MEFEMWLVVWSYAFQRETEVQLWNSTEHKRDQPDRSHTTVRGETEPPIREAQRFSSSSSRRHSRCWSTCAISLPSYSKSPEPNKHASSFPLPGEPAAQAQQLPKEVRWDFWWRCVYMSVPKMLHNQTVELKIAELWVKPFSIFGAIDWIQATKENSKKNCIVKTSGEK